MVNHHPAKFGGHGYCGSGDIMVLFCHVILGDDLTKGLDNFMGRSLSRWVTILPSLVAKSTVVVEMFLVRHVISQDHVIKGSCDFMGWRASK